MRNGYCRCPQVRSLLLDKCPCPGNMYRLFIHGSLANHRKRLQQLELKIAASALIRLCLIDNGHNGAD